MIYLAALVTLLPLLTAVVLLLRQGPRGALWLTPPVERVRAAVGVASITLAHRETLSAGTARAALRSMADELHAALRSSRAARAGDDRLETASCQTFFLIGLLRVWPGGLAALLALAPPRAAARQLEALAEGIMAELSDAVRELPADVEATARARVAAARRTRAAREAP